MGERKAAANFWSRWREKRKAAAWPGSTDPAGGENTGWGAKGRSVQRSSSRSSMPCMPAVSQAGHRITWNLFCFALVLFAISPRSIRGLATKLPQRKRRVTYNGAQEFRCLSPDCGTSPNTLRPSLACPKGGRKKQPAECGQTTLEFRSAIDGASVPSVLEFQQIAGLLAINAHAQGFICSAVYSHRVS